MERRSEVIQRIYTAIPLLGIAVAAIFYFNFVSFLLLDTLLILLIAWEWTRVIGYTDLCCRYLYLGVLLIGCIGGYYLPVKWVFRTSIVMGGLLLVNMVIALSQGKQWCCSKQLLSILGGLYFILAWYTLCFLKGMPIYLGMGLLIIVLTDTLAYIVGKHCGNHRFAPNISPNKMWEGFLAGLLGPAFVMLIVNKLSGYPFYKSHLVMGIAIFTSLAALAGDLFESAIKRQAGLKDSGDVLPGHGGWLDRFDSLVCAIPIFAVSLLYLPTL